MSKTKRANVYEWYESRNAYVETFSTPNIQDAEDSYFRKIANGKKAKIEKIVEYKPCKIKYILRKLLKKEKCE